MATGGTGQILFLLSQGEISASLLKHLPAGELITLARTNSALRAELHDFGETHPFTAGTSGVRPELQIGHHDTIRWKWLKANAPYECSSSTHTRGTDVKPCRYCSRLICGACMTRASFANPGEKTFQNRCRSLCESCWMTGNRHQKQKLTDDCECHQNSTKDKLNGSLSQGNVTNTCECTNKNDGWVCLECKHLQNKVWFNDKCFGQGCSNTLDGFAERRKICMWCDKPLPISATRENPHVYKQKVVDAMAHEAAIRQSDAEAHALKRRKQLRMSLRELRGDEAVAGNAMADTPNLVRHLDTVNYARRLGPLKSPTPAQVYNSKMGRWQYDRDFLVAFRNLCRSINVPMHVNEATRSGLYAIDRTNQELWAEELSQRRLGAKQLQQDWQQHSTTDWDIYRGQITRMRFLEQKSIKDIQDAIFIQHGIWESAKNYRSRLDDWKVESEDERSSQEQLTTQPDLLGSNCWRDVGSAVVDEQENVHLYPGARRSRDSQGRTHTSSSAPSSSVIAPTIPMNKSTSQTETDEAVDEIQSNYANDSLADRHNTSATTTSPTQRRSIAHIISDFQAHQDAISKTTFSNPEAMEQLLAEQAALQLEWEEALFWQAECEETPLADEANGKEVEVNHKKVTEREQERGTNAEKEGDGEKVGARKQLRDTERDGEGTRKRDDDGEEDKEAQRGADAETEGAARAESGAEAAEEEEEEADDENDDVNLLIAIHESLNEAVTAQGTQDENLNQSRDDGRPPMYFA